VLWVRKDPRLAVPLLERLSQETDLTIGDNEPYSGELEGDCMDQHAVRHGFVHVLIEIRQDLIDTTVNAEIWANRLSAILRDALARVDSNAKV
jgi:predicted N-formylglutamate amidohydrolase